MSTDKNRFFFEEDPSAEESGVTSEEHADTFLSIVADITNSDVSKQISSMEAMTPEIEKATQFLRNGAVEIEYGRIFDDYVLHVTPIHTRKNLSDSRRLREAIEQTIILLNRVVPTSTKVDIVLPQAEHEIKATSYLIRGAAASWNLDVEKMEGTIVPEILEAVTAVCVK